MIISAAALAVYVHIHARFATSPPPCMIAVMALVLDHPPETMVLVMAELTDIQGTGPSAQRVALLVRLVH